MLNERKITVTAGAVKAGERRGVSPPVQASGAA
jgi:hypothetical protein